MTNPSASTSVDLSYEFITDDEALARWADDTAAHPWIAFDTEFIGEKRFRTLLCLIQVATPDGLFLIDPIAIGDLDPFLDLVEDERILKITHAGENDYRLLYQNFGCEPRNLLDTQLACGFLSEQYPVNFKRLTEIHLGIELKKGFAVTDWARRPLGRDALRYALEDVVYLRDMLDVVSVKLRDKGRYAWFVDEMRSWEDVSNYEKTLLDEVKALGGVYKMRRAEKLFLVRMIEWRRGLAEQRDHSREMVLATKDLNAIVRAMKQGRKGFTANRHMKSKSWMRYFDEWQALYDQPATEEEKAMLAELTEPATADIRQEIVGEILYRYLRYHCLQHEIAVDLVLPRAVMRDLNTGGDEGLHGLLQTWRQDFLGADVLALLRKTGELEPRLVGSALHFEPAH